MSQPGTTATVLIISSPDDAEAELVSLALADLDVPAVWFDMADFPQRMGVTATLDGDGARWRGQLRLGRGQSVELDQVGAVYYRRPALFALPAGMTETDRRFAMAEARMGFGGLLASLPARWVNHPGRVADAEYKPAQLRAAAQSGLAVPATILTNTVSTVADFLTAQRDGVVYKPLSGGVLPEYDGARVVYTSRVDEIPDEASVAATMHLFQRWVPKRFDVRVTAIGEECFGIAVRAGSAEAHLDWRRDYDAVGYAHIDVPDPVRAGIGRYLERMGLRFGACDFSVDSDGRWVFLECNPNGQWAWLEEATGLGMSAALARLLATGAVS